MKKVLILGGKPIGSIELVKEAKARGCYTIVVDYLNPIHSPAKLYADEHWEISTASVEEIVRLCKQNKIEAIATGVHEFNINRMLEICELTGLPTYCTKQTWKYCDNKNEFKSLCNIFGIPTAKKYNINIENQDDLENVKYPVITKPADGSGSRGFYISYNETELKNNYYNSSKFSPSSEVIIEDYIPFDAVIIHYTMINGKCVFSGISDKKSATFPSTGAKVMGIQEFPSKGQEKYLRTLNSKVERMFEKTGFTNGPIWIEAFYDGNDSFIFNEMGYRFGGSLTYYPVKYFYGINQLELMLDNALGESSNFIYTPNIPSQKYCILPIHIKTGTISEIIGEQYLRENRQVYAYVPVHYLNDEIEDWGSAQQVFCYIHLLYKNTDELKQIINEVLGNLIVLDQKGNNMLYTLFDINTL